MGFVHVWYDDRYWSEVGQGHGLRIFMLKFLGPQYLQTLDGFGWYQFDILTTGFTRLQIKNEEKEALYMMFSSQNMQNSIRFCDFHEVLID